MTRLRSLALPTPFPAVVSTSEHWQGLWELGLGPAISSAGPATPTHQPSKQVTNQPTNPRCQSPGTRTKEPGATATSHRCHFQAGFTATAGSIIPRTHNPEWLWQHIALDHLRLEKISCEESQDSSFSKPKPFEP